MIEKLKDYFESGNEMDDKQIIKSMRGLIPEDLYTKASYFIFNAIFDMNITKNIEKNSSFLKEIYKTMKKREAEVDLLLNLETFLLIRYATVSFEKYIPTILQIFWTQELLSDDTLNDWDEGVLSEQFEKDFRYEKSLDDKFRLAARPFLDWLK